MATKYLERTVNQVIAESRSHIDDRVPQYKGLCQKHCREAYGVAAWAGSAIIAWETIPDKEKTKTGNVSKAPRGSLIYYRIGKYGHVVIAIGIKTHDRCLSNDYVRTGYIDVAPRSMIRWGAQPLGFSNWTPFGELKLVMPKWDGTVPVMENVQMGGQQAVYRVACRLHDLGFLDTVKQPGEQKLPVRAIARFQKSLGGSGTGKYGPKTHAALF